MLRDPCEREIRWVKGETSGFSTGLEDSKYHDLDLLIFLSLAAGQSLVTSRHLVITRLMRTSKASLIYTPSRQGQVRKTGL